MRYSVPVTSFDYMTGRVKQLRIWADSFGEERMLTQIHSAMETSDIDRIILYKKSGGEIILTFEEEDGTGL